MLKPYLLIMLIRGSVTSLIVQRHFTHDEAEAAVNAAGADVEWSALVALTDEGAEIVRGGLPEMESAPKVKRKAKGEA